MLRGCVICIMLSFNGSFTCKILYLAFCYLIVCLCQNVTESNFHSRCNTVMLHLDVIQEHLTF
jgi:hypothetical protein